MAFQRRELLKTAVAAGGVALAGCLDEPDDEESPDDEEPREEEQPDDGEAADEDTDQETTDEPEPAADVDYENPDGDVAFVQPEDGNDVTSPVEVVMEADEFEVEPAEEGVENRHGHLHIMVDVDCVDPGEYIPEEEAEGYIHYGEGETEDELELEPGEYDLCLQAGDGEHVAYDLTDEISITVDEE